MENLKTWMQTSSLNCQIYQHWWHERLRIAVCVVCICSAVVLCMCVDLCILWSETFKQGSASGHDCLSIVLPINSLFMYIMRLFIVCVWEREWVRACVRACVCESERVYRQICVQAMHTYHKGLNRWMKKVMIGFIHSYIGRMNVSYFALPSPNPNPTFLPLVHTHWVTTASCSSLTTVHTDL